MCLNRKFFLENADNVGKNLLGKYVLRREGKRVWGGKIVEVEAYLGRKDKAAHSYNGRRTKRTEIMFAGGGFVYMFFVYGVHWQLNFTAGKKGEGQAVLVRALEPVEQGLTLSGLQGATLYKAASGPGKVCRFLELDGDFYGENLSSSSKIWVENWSTKLKDGEIVSTKRVGIDYAGKWKDAVLRFYIKGSKSVSRK